MINNKIDDIIRKCYQEILGREPDPTGFNYYKDGLSSGKMKIEDFKNKLLNSSEFKNKSKYVNSWLPKDLEAAKKAVASTVSSEDFDKSGQVFAEKFVKFLDKEFVVMDYGCGIGRVAKVISSKVSKLYAVDISQKMIDFAKEYCRGFTNIDFILNDGSKIPLENNSIDFAYSILTLQHVEREDALLILDEIHRVLKPNARFFFTLPNLENEKNWNTLRNFAENSSTRVPHRIRLYTLQEVELFIKHLGFKIEEINDATIKPVNFEVTVSKIPQV